MRRGAASTYILGAGVVVVVFAILVAIPFIGVLAIVGKKLNQNTIINGAGYNQGGCYVTDEGFSDTTLAKTGDEIYQKLIAYYKDHPGKNYNNLTSTKYGDPRPHFDKQLQFIIDESVKRKINPIILVGIWGGEQSFGNEVGAMSYNFYDHDGDKIAENDSPGFDVQVRGALGTVEKSLGNISPYNVPDGENVFTRLFYTYNGSAKIRYNNHQPLFGESDAWMVVYKMFMADQYYQCGPSDDQYLAYEGTGPTFNSGETTMPFNKADFIGYGNSLHFRALTRCINGSGHRPFKGFFGSGNKQVGFRTPCTGEAVDLGVKAGAPVFAPFSGVAFKKNAGSSLENITVVSPDHRKVAVLAHVNSAGSISQYPKGTKVTVGAQIATIKPLKFAHLHFELWSGGKAVTVANPTKKVSVGDVWQAMKRMLALPKGKP